MKITNKELLEIASHPFPEYCSLEELKKNVQVKFNLINALAKGKVSYYEGPEEARGNLLCIAYMWAMDMFELRHRAKENWDFAMRIAGRVGQ
jgi:hypothetical protein